METTERIPIHKLRLFVGVSACIAPLLLTMLLLIYLSLDFPLYHKCILSLQYLGFVLILVPFSRLGMRLWLMRLCNGLRLLTSGPGVIVTDEYFEDQSGIGFPGKIPWSTVTEIKRVNATVRFGSFHEGIAVHIENPSHLIAPQNGLRRYALELNQAISGSPVYITTDYLQTHQNELYRKFMARFDPNYPESQEGYAPLARYLIPCEDSQSELTAQG